MTLISQQYVFLTNYAMENFVDTQTCAQQRVVLGPGHKEQRIRIQVADVFGPWTFQLHRAATLVDNPPQRKKNSVLA